MFKQIKERQRFSRSKCALTYPSLSDRRGRRSLQDECKHSALNINLSASFVFSERHIGRSLQENNFFCALYINLPFRLVGLSYAVEFLKDLGGDTRAVVGFDLELSGWWYLTAIGSMHRQRTQARRNYVYTNARGTRPQKSPLRKVFAELFTKSDRLPRSHSNYNLSIYRLFKKDRLKNRSLWGGRKPPLPFYYITSDMRL